MQKICGGITILQTRKRIRAKVIEAAEELGQPVILQFAPVHEEYISLKTIGLIMVLMADKAKVPVCGDYPRSL